MSYQYYKLPISFNTVFDENGEPMTTCNEISSIDQFLELLLTTCPGEHKFNKKFGCRIWEMDFERVVSLKSWVDDFTGHVYEAIVNFEKRLKDISVNVTVKDVIREDYTLQTTAIKKEVSVYINSRLVSNNESCKFKFILYLGPLSTQ